MKKFKVCVFCGHRNGNDIKYITAARGKQHPHNSRISKCFHRKTLGSRVWRRRHWAHGRNCKSSHGRWLQCNFYHSTCVLKYFQADSVETCRSYGVVVEVDSMHERKQEMSRLADAFIAMPGGYGTLEELLEMITWVQLGIHRKAVGILNVDGFYDNLLALFETSADAGFIPEEARFSFVSDGHPAVLADKLIQMIVPEVNTWAWKQDKLALS